MVGGGSTLAVRLAYIHIRHIEDMNIPLSDNRGGCNTLVRKKNMANLLLTVQSLNCMLIVRVHYLMGFRY